MKTIDVVPRDEWLNLRKRLLEKEKELTRLYDQLAEERRTLPWVRVEKDYVFEGPSGQATLSDLFQGKSQLLVYHFMFGPGWKEGCPVCSCVADHLDSSFTHLGARDVALAVISRAPYSEIVPFKARMGWRFPWVSSLGSDFNYDYRVSFSKEEVASGSIDYNYGTSSFPSEEAGGVSVFAKDAQGGLFHTYSAYARGAEVTIGAYALLDLVPKGRDEADLPWPTAWIRHHDKYRTPA